MSFYFSDLYTSLLVLYAVFVGILAYFDKERILLLMQYVINQKYAIKYHRQDSYGYRIFAYINTLFIIGIIISFYMFNNIEDMSMKVFGQVCVIISIWIGLKIAVIHFLERLFELSNYAQKYYYSLCSSLFFIGFISYPIILITSYYMNGFFLESYSMFIFYIFSSLYLILKVITFKRLNLFKIKYIFYNILYLCTLELFPYVGLFKLLNILN